MSVGPMQELLIDEFKDLYSAEKQIVRALPKLAKAGGLTGPTRSIDQSLGKDQGSGDSSIFIQPRSR